MSVPRRCFRINARSKRKTISSKAQDAVPTQTAPMTSKGLTAHHAADMQIPLKRPMQRLTCGGILSMVSVSGSRLAAWMPRETRGSPVNKP